MYPTLSLGPLAIPTAPLTILIGLWLVLETSERSARYHQQSRQLIYNLVFTGLIATFLGARLTFVALHWSAFQNNLWGIVWPLTNGYTGWAGLVIGVFVLLLYARRHQLPLWPTLDTLAPGLWVGLMTLSLADFLGGPGYGKTTNVLWGVEMFSLRRHPVQMYELLAGVVALWLWWRLTQKKQPVGMAFLASAAAYSALRLFVDAYRDNTPLTADGYHIVQLVAFAVMLACLFLISRLPQTSSEEAVGR